MPDDDLVSLAIAGRAFAGWKGMLVRLSMEHCANGFDLSLSDVVTDFVRLPEAIAPGEACTVRIGSDVVVTGFVDEIERDIDAGLHLVHVAGRDRTADLVDCSAVGKAGQWRGQRIETIAAELAAPFGVQVRADVDTGKALASFALQEGESAFEAIERAARIRGLLLVSDGLGRLLITRAGVDRAPTPLVLGSNVLAMRVRYDMRDRFSVYAAKGQRPGSDFSFGTAASQVKATARDAGVTRFRPLIVTSDVPDLAVGLQDRVQWECNVRAARSLAVQISVQGWRHAEGLWLPNTLVRVHAPEMNISDELLIAGVEFELGDRGSITRLWLTRSDAYSLLAMKEPAAGGAASSTWSNPAIVGHATGSAR